MNGSLARTINQLTGKLGGEVEILLPRAKLFNRCTSLLSHVFDTTNILIGMFVRQSRIPSFLRPSYWLGIEAGKGEYNVQYLQKISQLKPAVISLISYTVNTIDLSRNSQFTTLTCTEWEYRQKIRIISSSVADRLTLCRTSPKQPRA